MAYSILAPATRLNMIGTVGDATSRNDSVKYSWGYASTDVAATGEVAGYFPTINNGGPAFTVGDVIRAVWNAGVGATPVFKEYVVTALNPTTLAIQANALG